MDDPSEETNTDGAVRTEATFGHDSLDATDLVELLTAAIDDADLRPGTAQDLGGPIRLPVRVGRRRLGILLGRVPDDGSWLVAVGGGTSPVMRLLGSTEGDERARLVELVHAALASIDGVRDLRWHHPSERLAGDPDRSASTPWG